ncbi:MAG: radical SAM protein [Candidatus Eremiobacteraeota bacterium]|nr:radical SAM protein [Candidatus Eremiobacteraeota bacterium]
MEEEKAGGPVYILELTQRCNHSCPHCFNVWKLGGPYPEEKLDTEGWKGLVGKLKEETGCQFLTLSGGEPLLHRDFFVILAHIHSLGIGTSLITNGSLLTGEKIGKCIDLGVEIFELPLLSNRREVHNGMSGAPSFDKVVNAVADIKERGGKVVTVFVATKKNIGDFEKTFELAFALGVDGIMLNRFNPGGGAVEIMESLLPSIESLRKTLDSAERLSEKTGIPVSCAIPMPPCVFPMEKYRRVGSGFCPVGTDSAYYTIDPCGNVRPCNHSTVILGNLLEMSVKEILESPRLKVFIDAIPPFCAPCSLKETCRGSCKASAQVCYGDLMREEPFLVQAARELPALAKR